MLVIPGFAGKDTCDGTTRRDFMRVGGSAVFGLSLADLFRGQARAETTAAIKTEHGGPGFGMAKNVILIYLQGGPSHLDLWDPKDGVPEKNKSVFKAISTKTTGLQFTENLPRLATVTDKLTMIRAMSYTPV